MMTFAMSWNASQSGLPVLLAVHKRALNGGASDDEVELCLQIAVVPALRIDDCR
jgi:hypothetical protein